MTPQVSSSAFDPFALLKVLQAHQVQLLLIGGIAGVLHGSPSMTNDLDICHSRDMDNLRKLAAALVELNARLRGAPEDAPFILDARTLAAGGNFTFSTTAGALDCLAFPSGSKGYDELIANAVSMDLDGLNVKVVALNDLIRIKRAAGRPKDLIEVEILGALRDEIEKA